MAAWTEQSLSQSSRVTSAWSTLSINQSASSVPENCIIVGWNFTIPWDNPKNLISRETELLVDRLKSGIFIPILYLIGAPTNVVNMAVFFRQGLSKRINMCPLFPRTLRPHQHHCHLKLPCWADLHAICRQREVQLILQIHSEQQHYWTLRV